MGKVIRVSMSDGTMWDIPAETVAKSRADYYARWDSERGDGTYHEVYEKEFEITMQNRYELLDYATNNMNWSDVVADAVQVPTPPPAPADYAREWSNAEKTVVTV